MAPPVNQQIAEHFPFLAFLANDREIGPILRRAVDPNRGYSPEKFRAEVLKTSWWKKRSETQREWLIKVHTDPGTAKQERGKMWSEVATQAANLGLALSGSQKKWLTEMALSMGLTPDHPSMMAAYRNLFRSSSLGRRQPGAIDAAAQAINARSKEFMVPITPQQAYYRGELVATGAMSMEASDASLRVQAARRYPHLKDMLAQGMTVHDAIRPNVELYAQEMEISVDQMWRKIWSNGHERQLLNGIRDPKTGKNRLPTASEAVKLARSTPSWWNTSGGRQADSQMANTLMQAFGQRR